jgi:predicted nuclease of predicted toxin-antitoxin system
MKELVRGLQEGTFNAFLARAQETAARTSWRFWKPAPRARRLEPEALVYLVIDECCGKKLGPIAEGHGHVAQRSVEVAQLGPGASDADIFAFAKANGAVVVTINQGDFLALAKRTDRRPGLILLPPLRGAELARLFRTTLSALAAIFEGAEGVIVQIGVDGEIKRVD